MCSGGESGAKTTRVLLLAALLLLARVAGAVHPYEHEGLLPGVECAQCALASIGDDALTEGGASSPTVEPTAVFRPGAGRPVHKYRAQAQPRAPPRSG